METKGGFYISQIKQLQDRIFEKLLAEEGIHLGGGQGRILFVLWKSGDLTVSEIGRHTSLAINSVSIIVNGLVEKGILHRNKNPHNRRETIISLSDKARSMRGRYEEVSERMNQLFYEGFEADEVEVFENCLERILQTLLRMERAYTGKGGEK